MSIVSGLRPIVTKAIKDLYGQDLNESDITINATKPEFEGDYTVVLFSFVKQLRKSPEALGNELGERLKADNPSLITSYNVIKGFLNLVISDTYWADFLYTRHSDEGFGKFPSTGKTIIVEYSSPNTNKPLHLGHLRNNFLGWSVAEILKNAGYVPPEVEALNEIRDLERFIVESPEDKAGQKAVKKLALLRTRIEGGYYEKALAKLSR